MIEEYKGLTAFLKELAMGSTDAYKLKFTKCKDKVAQDFPKLDLSIIVNIEPKEVEGYAKEAIDIVEEAEVIGTEEVIVEAFVAKATIDA